MIVAFPDGAALVLQAVKPNTLSRRGPIQPEPLTPTGGFVTAFHLWDLVGPDDAWRPGRLRKAAAAAAEALRPRRRFQGAMRSSSSKTFQMNACNVLAVPEIKIGDLTGVQARRA